ncbi:hypothetical protein QBC38DRAFT_490934 [Podospora fimiseda]|uniref:DUF2828 domain-containing protein n=1 Tax=Podospora fimiseda TaxID=252190 RepID=A0AAN7BGL8_9PEZI|nr:hypothetical protein QBC38DRAFT_490934 [Podospora fimiseda]
MSEANKIPFFLKAKWPVLLPVQPELALDDEAFAKFLCDTVKPTKYATASTVAIASDPVKIDVDNAIGTKFMSALMDRATINDPNHMETENGDPAFKSTKNPLVDLFYELEQAVSSTRLNDLLIAAWAENPLATLKIVFNARSIHLGKSDKKTFYRAAGWFAEYHPLTFIKSLLWLTRPIIPKKVEQKDEDEDDIVVIDANEAQEEGELSRFDVKNGVSHGYWKDLLNILVLAANQKLTVFSDPSDVLNTPKGGAPGTPTDAASAGANRHRVRDERAARVTRLLEQDPVYRGLHLTIARLFAEQLKVDLALLKNGDAKAKRQISLCGKWTPSNEYFHDKHTLVTSSIAELLYPEHMFAGSAVAMADRTSYLCHAREYLRKDLVALRNQLEVVECQLSANKVGEIKYDRVPSIAMNNYSKIFATKDEVRFRAYLRNVAEGKARISGATLLPSTLIKAVRDIGHKLKFEKYEAGQKRPAAAIDVDIKRDVINGQWNTLVQRIKDSGTLESAIAICDVSGSMQSPEFKDGTCPMDSAIGLSMILAEVTQPPFGGSFISFSKDPKFVQLDLTQPLDERYETMLKSDWGFNTNVTAVFEKLILPRAVKHNVPADHMPKRVFVFSDMQFDSAEDSEDIEDFSTSFERIQEAYKAAGYEMPELVFWNLAGGRAGYGSYAKHNYGEDTAPKPVTADQKGVSLVSGYSQAMLKVFMDKGSFEEEVEEGDVEMKDEEGVVLVDKKRKVDPLARVMTVISHKAYEMLEVVD